MSIYETAMAFFEACETGKGWEQCSEWCHQGASFSCQAEALAGVVSVHAAARPADPNEDLERRTRIGGLLNFYYREVA